MTLSVGQTTRIYQTYRSQEKIAELNKQSGLRTVQGQVDSVSISARARELLQAQQERDGGRAPSTTPVPAPEVVREIPTPNAGSVTPVEEPTAPDAESIAPPPLEETPVEETPAAEAT